MERTTSLPRDAQRRAAASRSAAALGLIALLAPAARAEEATTLRPPAVPLVTHDPYFSIWSFGDQLAGDWPRHWTGAVHALCSMVRVDGRTYRLMGAAPPDVPVADQRALRVLPTRTIYEFAAGGVQLSLTFTSPLLPDDLDLVSRPVTYLTWEARSADGREHAVVVYYDNSAELVVDKPGQAVTWSKPTIEGLAVLEMASADQPVLEKDGDNLRIDWGSLYVAATESQRPRMAVLGHERVRGSFAETGQLPAGDDLRQPRPANDDWPLCACVLDLGAVGSEPRSAWLMLAYDDLYSIQYLGRNLRPWWRRDGLDAAGLLRSAARDYASLLDRCRRFDQRLRDDCLAVGGPQYAELCSLAYRQAIAAHKLVAAEDGAPLLFSKECFSNGCIATVDVAYPAAPIFMLLSSDLLKASIEPVMQYAASPRWKFDFAPHDLGRYPKANGQRYGGGETSEDRQMPVEECGNLLVIAAAISQMDGNAEYARRHWPLLNRWARYLESKGLDPENQLCTDDFAGHLAHNANLSVKAIVALACYAKICRMAGEEETAAAFQAKAESFARQWVELADDGDHYRLAFDKPGTWSQKYNLVWDDLLGLHLFPPEVRQKEIAFYKSVLQPYGLPLDNRELYTKTDWEVWTATWAGNREDFDSLMQPLYRFVSATPQRVPLTDWYWAHNAEHRGFQARPVIGGVFIRLLADAEIPQRWSGGMKPIPR